MNHMPHSAVPDAAGTHKRSPRLASMSAMAASLTEYYDFMLFATAAALVFPRIFFPDAGLAAGTMLSLASYGVSYVARPIGALVLGSMADRIGRRALLQITVWMMGIATLAVGCLPTYDQIGILAPILLVVCRLFQGFSTAAEAPAAAALALEHAGTGTRAFGASWTASGVQGGQALASLVFIPVAALPADALYSWGWRLPFFASVLLFAVNYGLRRHVSETPVFLEAVANRDPKLSRGFAPIKELLRSDKRNVLRVAGAAFFAVPSSLATVYGLSYATSPDVGVSRQSMLWGVAIANIIAVFVIPFWGWLADRTGRKPIFIGGAIGSALFFWLYMVVIDTGQVGLILAVTIVFLGVVYSAPNSIQESMFPEWFPTRTRVLGSAFGKQVGLIAFGFAPATAQVLSGGEPSNWGGVVLMLMALTSVAVIAAMTAPETRHRGLDGRRDLPKVEGKTPKQPFADSGK